VSFEADLTVDARNYPSYERVFTVLATAFVVLLVLTNVIGIKLFRAPFNPEFALTTGILTYPLTFLFTDLVSEIYGKRRADFMVVLGFVMSLVMLGIVQLAVAVEPHPYWVPPVAPFYGSESDYQHAFESVFALNGILLFGSMSAYLAAQLADNRLYHFWKRVTKGKHLWLRNNASTWVSQLIDTGVVGCIFFYGGLGMDFGVGLKVMATIYVYKLVIAALDTPFIYLGVWIVRSVLAASEEPDGA
jgi:queuosine precursor transporter